MKTTAEWLTLMLAEYDADKQSSLLEALETIVSVGEQWQKNQESHAAKGVLISGIEHMRLFLNMIKENERR